MKSPMIDLLARLQGSLLPAALPLLAWLVLWIAGILWVLLPLDQMVGDAAQLPSFLGPVASAR